ncbi:uncharacterized protein RMCC_2610 [Mycolicibacterium canariasense]|uniref:Uncharacterized protein n=1 Tax=Mycolicibacterium canariasense TaxID=228230 RepID=A0A117IA13_MYCCR|nr:hypothetical protein [Mycolicibacterium canariasense]MCV7212793.1 hypothetical protein [Mycolicibacterium canariasense]GAS95644.1 uncharacterized protein RMCC_2610 [Mycolicibacterium canariasense]
MTHAPESRIFDAVERTDSAPAYDTEDSFHFLNRAAGAPWQRVRDLVESWFADYPDHAKPDLRSRFREVAAPQHYGAWWELYVYTLHRRLGYEVTIHPTLPGTPRQPDFLVSRGDTAAYVECAVYLSRAGSAPNGAGERSWIFEATNQASDPNFFVDIKIRRAGTDRPKASEIIGPVQQWLSSLDPDDVADQISRGGGRPDLILKVRGWEIEYGAWPVRPEHRGTGGRLIGVYPTVTAFISNDMLRIRDLMKHKGGRYGSPDKPLKLAILNTSGFAEAKEINEALFGTKGVSYYVGQPNSAHLVDKRDGYWRKGPPARGSRVSAVLVGQNIYPWRICPELPKLWINPWAHKPLVDFPLLETYTAQDAGEVHLVREAGATPDAIFGLDREWPGFETRQ